VAEALNEAIDTVFCQRSHDAGEGGKCTSTGRPMMSSGGGASRSPKGPESGFRLRGFGMATRVPLENSAAYHYYHA
jgi:hypothetical protein